MISGPRSTAVPGSRRSLGNLRLPVTVLGTLILEENGMRRNHLSVAVALAGALLLATAAFAATVNPSSGGMVPSGKGFGVHDPQAPAGVGLISERRGTQIIYHGGPVILGTVHIYNIWYGNWSGNSAPTILDYFASHIGGSSYWNMFTTYYQISGGVKTFMSNSVSLAGEYFDSYSQGSNLDDNGVFAVVTNAINGGHLPSDTHGIYFVLTSSDVNETTGFCTVYCGWHTFGTINGADIKFSFVGNPDRCPSACEFIAGNAPNGNAGADGMASIIAHEMAESATDPDLNAWYFSNGNENGDQCAWTFGTTFSCNGGTANINLGSRCYLIQRDWKNTGSTSACVMHYP
jgi:hypothetical protein